MDRFLDQLTKKDVREANKNRIKDCPYPKSCMPNSYTIGKNKAGVCVGIIHNVNHLDCIRICNFFEDLEANKLAWHENFMTPDEAIAQARALLMAAENALNSSSSYNNHYKHLHKLRKQGDKTPQC